MNRRLQKRRKILMDMWQRSIGVDHRETPTAYKEFITAVVDDGLTDEQAENLVAEMKVEAYTRNLDVPRTEPCRFSDWALYEIDLA